MVLVLARGGIDLVVRALAPRMHVHIEYNSYVVCRQTLKADEKGPLSLVVGTLDLDYIGFPSHTKSTKSAK